MSRNNYSISNRTTSINNTIDVLATEGTLKTIRNSLATGTFTSSDTLTHTKLDTLNTTITNKHLTTTDDSVTIPALEYGKDSVSVYSEQVSSIPYDLNLLGTAMYADSINGPILDPYGREGWYWTNGATTGGSNCYWYNNVQTPQIEMTKEQIECAYVVMSIDKTQPAIVLPIFCFYSAPTGSGDHIPGFAHSAWSYTIPTTHILNVGEQVMLTVGDYTKVANIFPELRRIHLELSVASGDCGSAEVIDFMSLNTDSGLKDVNAIQYLLTHAGFYYSVSQKTVDYAFKNSLERLAEYNLANGSNSLVQLQGYSGTEWQNLTSTAGALSTTDAATTSLDGKVHSATEVDTDAIKVYTVNSSSSTVQAVLPSAPTVGVPLSATTYNDGTYDHYSLETFDNTLNSKIHSATLVDTDAIKVYTVNSSGSGGLVQLQAYNTSTATYEDLYTTIGGHLLKTQACVHDYNGQDISSTVVGATRGLNVYTINANSNLGTYGNMVNSATIVASGTSSPLAISNTYLNESVLTYSDTSTGLTSNINILASNDGTNYSVIGTIQPVLTITNRTASAILKLKAFTHIYIQNCNTVSSVAGVVCSLYSS